MSTIEGLVYGVEELLKKAEADLIAEIQSDNRLLEHAEGEQASVLATRIGRNVKFCQIINETLERAKQHHKTLMPDNEWGVSTSGWICPRCQAVLAPSVKECPHCREARQNLFGRTTSGGSLTTLQP